MQLAQVEGKEALPFYRQEALWPQPRSKWPVGVILGAREEEHPGRAELSGLC